MRNAAGTPQGTATFGSMADWGGGFVTHLSIHPTTGRMVIGCDAFGAYVRDPSDTRWRQMLSSSVLPVGEYPNSVGYVSPSLPNYAGSNQFAGCDVAIAPSNQNRIYVLTNARCYRSDDGGLSLIRTGMPDTHNRGGEGVQRLWNHRIAVDTQNADVVVVGSHDSPLQISTNAGVSFTNVSIGANSTFENLQGTNVYDPQLVACDPSGPVSGGIKQRWFAVRQGTGVYISTNGPAGSYTLMSGSPLTAQNLVVDQNGNCWVADKSGGIWKYTKASNAWATVPNPGLNCAMIAVDPFDANRIVFMDLGVDALVTNDGGATWQGGIYNRAYPISTGTINRWATTVPSLNYGKFALTFPAMIQFDPLVRNKLYMAEGTGVCWCTPPTGFSSVDAPQNRWDWYEISEGIKELVSEAICVPPGGNPVLTYWDKPTFAPSDKNNLSAPIRSLPLLITSPGDVKHGWDVAYAADNPKWLAILCTNIGSFDLSSFSTDGGYTWTRFPTTPPYVSPGGCVAVGNSGNVILMRSNNGWPVYTKDNGRTWAVLPFPGLPAVGVINGFGLAYYYNRKIVTYDIPGAAFYLYNFGVPGNAAATVGVWKSVDQGDTWTRVYAAKVSGFDDANVRLIAVPGQAGHLFYSAGYSANVPIRRSTDGGVSWSDVTGTSFIEGISFGKAAPGKTYPTVFMAGKVSGAYGFYRSDDNCVSWKLLTTAPDGNFDPVSCIAGDPDIYGRIYIGMHASGFYYGDYNFPMQLKP